MYIIQKGFYFTKPLEELGKITKLVVHHSSRMQMTAEECHDFHQKEYGWSGIGYNFFIEKNGMIVEGRGFHVGSHAYGHNRDSLGICMTGDFDVEWPTEKQWHSFYHLCRALMDAYHLSQAQVVGHRELSGVTKSCPGLLIDMESVRRLLS